MLRPVILTLLLGLSLLPVSQAEQAYLRASCEMDFPEAMLHLQDSIRHYGYTVSRVQHVDKGLEKRGYNTEAYKVVFFGKPDEIDHLRKELPALIPFIPLSITILEEGQQTLVSTMAPGQLSQIITDFNAQIFFRRWQQHMEQIIQRYAACQTPA